MKKILSLAAVALLMSGCAVYGDGYYDNAPRKRRIHMVAHQAKPKRVTADMETKGLPGAPATRIWLFL